jgi:hypothetical protein
MAVVVVIEAQSLGEILNFVFLPDRTAGSYFAYEVA